MDEASPLASKDRTERYGHAINGNCHIKLKEVQVNGQKFVGEGALVATRGGQTF